MDKQNQKAGDNSQLVQAGVVNINVGVDEKRAREIFMERFEDTRKFLTQEAFEVANARVNEFENILSGTGVIILKFWLHIDKNTQLERFKSRQNEPKKNWKITPDDWRNREKWDIYKNAADEMLHRTSTLNAPWIIVESNDKLYSRTKILEVIFETLEKELKN